MQGCGDKGRHWEAECHGLKVYHGHVPNGRGVSPLVPLKLVDARREPNASQCCVGVSMTWSALTLVVILKWHFFNHFFIWCDEIILGEPHVIL